MKTGSFESSNRRGLFQSFLIVIAIFGCSFVAAAGSGKLDENKQKIVFVVNTTERDDAGTFAAPYVSEARWIEKWKKVAPDAKIVRIRADKNADIRQQLQNWMRPDADRIEIVGMSVHSHGFPDGELLNESGKFWVRIPETLNEVFGPLIGHFGENARIMFDGCLVLGGQDSTRATSTLNGVANALGIKSGYIYANETKGGEMSEAFADPFNPDTKPQGRKKSAAAYALWPVTVPGLYLVTHFAWNKGYTLEKFGTATRIFKTNADAIFEPTLRTLKAATPLVTLQDSIHDNLSPTKPGATSR